MSNDKTLLTAITDWEVKDALAANELPPNGERIAMMEKALRQFATGRVAASQPMPDMANGLGFVIDWLEGGKDPLLAAKELRSLVAASPAPVSQPIHPEIVEILADALRMFVGDNARHSLCRHEGMDAFGRVKGTWSAAAEVNAKSALNILAASTSQAAEPAPPAEMAGTLPLPVLQALRFYANGDHLVIDGDCQEFDTVSGEPDNWLFSGKDDDTTMLEDGCIARFALMGKALNWIEGDDDASPKPIEGEAFAQPVAQKADTEPVAWMWETENKLAFAPKGLEFDGPEVTGEQGCKWTPLVPQAPALTDSERMDAEIFKWLMDGPKFERIKISWANSPDEDATTFYTTKNLRKALAAMAAKDAAA
jgi:hypothetical protein